MVILHGFPRRGIVMDKEEFNKLLDEIEKKKQNIWRLFKRMSRSC